MFSLLASVLSLCVEEAFDALMKPVIGMEVDVSSGKVVRSLGSICS